jgi:hypothetical protein
MMRGERRKQRREEMREERGMRGPEETLRR